jgi:hypothetical protein
MHLTKKTIVKGKTSYTYQSAAITTLFSSSLFEDHTQAFDIDACGKVPHSSRTLVQNLGLDVQLGKVKTCQESSHLDL